MPETAPPETVHLFGVPIANASKDEAVEWITARLRAGGPPAQVNFVNAHCVNTAARDPEYRRILLNSERNFADGAGMRIAARVLGAPLRDNVNGTDLYPILIRRLNHTGLRIFPLGAAPGAAEAMRDNALRGHPGLCVCGTHHGYFTEAEEPAVLETVRAARPHLLLVALGVPRQEKWLARNLAKTGAAVGMGVGGLFNFYSGRIPRAPVWMQRIGMEWLHRLAMEPSRLWRRYLLGNAEFLLRTLAWRLTAKRRR